MLFEIYETTIGLKWKELDLSKKIANVTNLKVKRSCSRLMVGKCFWKSVILLRQDQGTA